APPPTIPYTLSLHDALPISNISSFIGRNGIGSASDLAGRLLRESHVATVPGEGFGTRDHIRVSYATTVAELDRGLERMRKFLTRSEEHTSELQSRENLVCRL